MKGVLNKEYAIARQTKKSHIYRLKRRTSEVLKEDVARLFMVNESNKHTIHTLP